MTITPGNILRHELIGLEVEIEKSTSPSMHGLAGRVVDESYGTLRVEVEKAAKTGRKKAKKNENKKIVEKVIPKSNSIFIFTLTKVLLYQPVLIP